MLFENSVLNKQKPRKAGLCIVSIMIFTHTTLTTAPFGKLPEIEKVKICVLLNHAQA